MIPTKLEITDFFSFGSNTIVNFEEKGNLILTKGEISSSDNSNGAGKSSLFESIYWCLTGKTVRGATAADVIRFGQSKATVAYSFKYQDKDITVTRIYSSNEKKVLLSINNKIEEFHDSKQGTNRIFEVLGLNEEIFSLLTFYGKNFTKFSSLTPKDKANIVDILSQSKVYDDAKDRATRDYKEHTKKYDLEDRDLANLVEQENTINSDISNLNMSLADRIRVTENKKQRINDEISEIAPLKQELEDAIKKLECKVPNEDDIRKKIAKITSEKEYAIKVHQDNINTYRLERDEAIAEFNKDQKEESDKVRYWSDDMRDKTIQIDHKTKKMNSTTCIECGQELPNQPDKPKLLTEIADLQKSKDKSEVEKKYHEEKVVLLDNAKYDYDNAYNGIVNQKTSQLSGVGTPFDEQIQEIQENVRKDSSAYNELLKDKNLLDSKINNLTYELDKCNNDSDVIKMRTLIESKQKEVENIKSGKEEKEKSLKSIATDVDISKYWAKGMKDLRFSAFESTCKALETLLTSFCESEGLDFDRVRVSPWKENASGSIVPEISVTVVRGTKHMRLESLSEGEMQRVDLAVFFSFSHLIEQTLGIFTKFKVLDEPLTGLDVEGKYKIFGVIASLSEQYQIVTIDHDANFSDLFTDVITVRKENGISSIAE